MNLRCCLVVFLTSLFAATSLAEKMPDYNWVFRARPVRIIDGDTIVVDIDLGFDLTLQRHLRLHGVQAPEKDEPGAKAAIQFVEDWIEAAKADDNAWPLIVSTMKFREGFGRYLAKVWRRVDKQQLGPALINNKLAKPR